MGIVESLLAEFEHEVKPTRELLSRVPADKGDWRPHPKSSTLAFLVLHIANLANWMTYTFRDTELDLNPPGGFPKRTFTTTEALLADFDKYVEGAREMLKSAKNEEMGTKWTLRNGGREVFSLPRAAVARSFVMNHLIHHRGQLTVYLRLLDVPLPSVYGPSADEGAVGPPG